MKFRNKFQLNFPLLADAGHEVAVVLLEPRGDASEPGIALHPVPGTVRTFGEPAVRPASSSGSSPAHPRRG